MNRNYTEKKKQHHYLLALILIIMLVFLCRTLGPEHYNVWLAQ
ncbi:hypothetical protein [Pedobacter sp. BMA]|nr:hypothetical protein [Pedobacter sp. BMA]